MNLKLGNSLKGRLIVRFGTLIIIFILCVGATYFILNRTIDSNDEINTVYTPSVKKVQEAKLMMSRANTLISNWVTVASDNNNADKKKLLELMNTEYPQMIKKLRELSSKWTDADKARLDSVEEQSNLLFKQYKEQIIAKLNSFESYSDVMIVMEVAPLIDNQGSITAQYKVVNKFMDALVDSQSKSAIIASDNLSTNLNQFKYLVILAGVLVLILGSWIALATIKNIVEPIDKVKNSLKLMGKGEILQEHLTTSTDEIGEMSAALNYLSDGLRKTADYAEKIGNGNLDATFVSLGEEDLLGNSLLEMGKKLKTLNEEDKRRNWVTAGLAEFADTLRSSNDLKKLSDILLSNLIRYIGANQGGIYLVNEADYEEPRLELIAYFAYERKKYLEKVIEPGEGLLGQCMLERDTIYLTDVPDGYIQITSGTGAATPRCIVLQPIMNNDEFIGVFEIASFKVLDKYEMEFLIKLSESMASVFSSVKINQKTVKLLEEARMSQESKREQEEELRQNLEELNATQEEMKRKEFDYLRKIEALEEELAKKK